MHRTVKIKAGELEFTYLPSYARYILENHLDSYVQESIRIAREIDLPLLKYLKNFSEEQLFALSKKTSIEFLTYFVENKARDQINEAIKRWFSDQLPIITRENIIAEDITQISYLRKQVLLKFLPAYGRDLYESLEIVKEIDQFILEAETVSTKMYIDLLKEKISENEQLYKQAETLTHLGNWRWDLATNTLEWSDELYRMYELPLKTPVPDEFIASFNHPEDRERVKQIMIDSIKNNSAYDFTYRIILKGGRQKTLHAKGEILTDEVGKPYRLFGTLQDITERHQLVEQLQQSERLYKQAEHLAHIGSWKWTIGSDEIIWSDELYRIYDLDPQSQRITLDLFKSFVHPEDRQNIEAGLTKIIHEQEQDFTFRIITSKGRHKTLRSLAKLQQNEDGQGTIIFGTEQDITERQELIEQLQEQEDLYKQAESMAHIGNWKWDIKNNSVYWSDELYRIYGIEPQSEEITYESYQTFIHPEDRSKVLQTVGEAVEKNKNYFFQHRIIQRNGSERVIHANGKVVTDANGHAIWIVGVSQDITERQQLIDRLVQNQMFIKKIADATPSIIASYNIKTGVYSFVSGGLQKLLGYEPSIALKEGVGFFSGLIHPDDVSMLVERNSEALQSANLQENREDNSLVVEFIYRMRHLAGDYRWFHTFGTIFDRDASGQVENVLNISIDITERIRAEEKVKEQEHFIKHIADASPTILYLLNLITEKIIYVNHEIRYVLGFEPAELMELEHGLLELYHPDDLAMVLEKKKDLYNKGGNGIIEYECRVRDNKDSYAWLLVREIVFERDEQGVPAKLLGAAIDITERKEIEQTLSQKNIELQQSNANLEEFAYVASHDLKEPLRKISIFGDRLMSTESNALSEEGKMYLDKVIDSARRMQGLITDLLSVSMISIDKSFRSYSLQAILDEVIKTLEHKIEEQKAVIESDELPEVNIVPSQFRQLLQNLLMNSLKFNQKGLTPHIKIQHEWLTAKDAQKHNLPKSKNYLQVTISDNGIGFDNMFANKIFTIFQRLHSRSEFEGSGIGLAICKKIIENHGGIIFAQGSPGNGAKFTFVIPTT